MTRTSRLARRILAILVPVILGLIGLGALPAVAGPLTSVSHVSVAISPPSSAAGALTTYVVKFTTSASGSLSGNAGAEITVSMPSGTGLTDLGSSTVTVAGNQVGDCFEDTASVAFCEIFSGDTVPASAAVTVTLNGVNNPATAKAYTLSVSTTSDTTAVTSPSYTVTAAAKVKALSMKPSSSRTGATNVTYTVQFTTATGLAGNSGSEITLTFPSGTGLTTLGSSTVTVAGNQVGDCFEGSTATVAFCEIFSDDTVAAGARVVVSLTDVSNPNTTKAYRLKVSTTSDVETASSSYCIAASGVPCIAKLGPASGVAGTAVKITGVNLAGATAVDFNGTAAVISTDTATKITTAVPAGATSGPVTVTTPGGTATSPSSFTVT